MSGAPFAFTGTASMLLGVVAVGYGIWAGDRSIATSGIFAIVAGYLLVQLGMRVPR